MKIEQFHDGCVTTLRCSNCGRDFEVSRHELSNPERLTAKKERISDRHTCGRRRNVFPLEDTRSRALNQYYERELRRFMSA